MRNLVLSSASQRQTPRLRGEVNCSALDYEDAAVFTLSGRTLVIIEHGEHGKVRRPLSTLCPVCMVQARESRGDPSSDRMYKACTSCQSAFCLANSVLNICALVCVQHACAAAS